MYTRHNVVKKQPMTHIPSACEDALSGNPRSVPLSPAEVAIMEYVAQGYDNQQIAEALGNRPGTVVHHIKVARVKLKVRGQSREALIAAYRATRET